MPISNKGNKDVNPAMNARYLGKPSRAFICPFHISHFNIRSTCSKVKPDGSFSAFSSGSSR